MSSHSSCCARINKNRKLLYCDMRAATPRRVKARGVRTTEPREIVPRYDRSLTHTFCTFLHSVGRCGSRVEMASIHSQHFSTGQFQQSTNIRQKAFTICLNFSSRYHLGTVVAAVVVDVAAAVVDLQVVIRVEWIEFRDKMEKCCLLDQMFREDSVRCSP
jgi:hypothetical protein